ncbi:hypothetical protein SAMN02745751_03555 [Dethiosulfatibacter aminovorans DSM 17477]|uniref:Uncharacterized protein n=1 Tax=Dethiosulfatibacter aminovorans DSM 17477 TaxID=1121476 RepID=A0A1M6MQR1_9FIRM|nr:tautomerase family protein [Dethiosulfatibacter aminovorans]SHJ85739.1 hypothetical protein SAMN02745751_03555 [Dethiosulfatibacter aminovorans DSM 17477]
MPHISMILYPGRSKDELAKISRNIQQCLVETAGWDEEDISVSFEVIESHKFITEANRKIANQEILIPSSFIR